MNLIAGWERFHYLAAYLVLHDPEARITSTNETESILREIEVGTLTQTSSAAGSLSTESGTEAKVGDVTSSSSRSGGIELSYKETLERKLREQLNFRSSAIEAQGRIFRLTQRASVENKIPSMARQILTVAIDPVYRVTVMEATFNAGGLVESLSLEPGPQYSFERHDGDDLGVFHELRATPIVLAVVRRIKNFNGAQTLGYDDDDQAELQVELRPLAPITLTRLRYRRQGVSCGGDLFLYYKASEDVAADLVQFDDVEQAERLAAFVGRMVRTLPENDAKAGKFFGYSKDNKLKAFRLGCHNGTEPQLDPGGQIGVDPGVVSPSNPSRISL